MVREVVHEHDHHESGGDGGSGIVIGVILLVLLIVLLYIFGNGIFGNNAMPGIGGSGTDIQVPGQIDVNLNQK